MPADTLYEDDIVSWSERQAQAIRELARTRPELSNLLDWENIAEEIETLGRSEWKAVASHIRMALAHILKEVCDPAALSRLAWRGETRTALRDAREDFLPSMRQHLDLDRIWKRAFAEAVDALQPYGVRIPPGIPERSPFTLDALLSPDFDPTQGVLDILEKIDQNHVNNRGN
jgi:hypothetical protein